MWVRFPPGTVASRDPQLHFVLETRIRGEKRTSTPSLFGYTLLGNAKKVFVFLWGVNAFRPASAMDIAA